MLPFFTNPYPDELLYSTIARYHFYSGNLDCKDTLEELFGSRSVISSVEIGSYFSVLAEQLGPQYSAESLLSNHTIYPYYASFLSKQRQQEILQDVLEDGQSLYTRLGIVAGSVCRKDGLYYCVECSKADNAQYGEPYIHREHQLQGINYCPHHEVQLRQYSIKSDSRIAYVRFEIRHMNLSPIYESDPYKELAIEIAKEAYRLLQLPLHELSREAVSSKYRSLLRKRNLITASNYARQKELYQAIASYFPPGFLQQYESELNEVDEYNWLKVLTRNSKRHVHPLRHLFLLHFLQQNIADFTHLKTDQGAFGAGPFPCLNKAASHYRQLVIQDVDVTRDFKTKKLIGTFTCSCEFIYARKQATDMFKIGRVKVFGEVWQQKLHELSNEDLSIRVMARELGVDSKTIKRYLTGNVELKQEESLDSVALKLMQYQQELLNGIKQFPDLSRTALRKKFKKQYMYLYRHDKAWLDETLPVIQRKQKPTTSVDWSKRDQQYMQQINLLHQQLLQEEKPVRITVSKIGKRLRILANLERHLDKLPKTKQLLNEITESIQEFQFRRCYKVIDDLLDNNVPVLLWQVQRIAAIKKHHFHEMKPQLERYIEMKQEVRNSDRATS
ncbi:TnsD family Tn7-like transposition protein [Lysinibacillus sp. G4S2]|uniref:TnsD family Tn7-like transposition protein n=1 Tax=Lysinibacillus sp. G4S2 TaxID=3055859 RepID=UPI0025A271D4|nr:TnsD family Tn7-like transposition protein [Lysinibacillus sp. G4S2]MDM5250813.1 TnsD family Tn7-like transposition protein [Lysinibacillus sp. G4S2]